MSSSTNVMSPLDRSLLSDLVAATVRGDEEQARRLLSLGVRPDVIDEASGSRTNLPLYLEQGRSSWPGAAAEAEGNLVHPDLPAAVEGVNYALIGVA
jgi:hypothetical protein